MQHRQYNQGSLLVEVLVGAAIIGVVLVAMIFVTTTVLQSLTFVEERNKALLLSEEGIEFLFYLRSESWSNVSSLTTGTEYYFDVTPTIINSTSTPELIDSMFARSFTIEPLYRDADDDIVSSTTAGAVVDPGAFHAFVTVTSSSSVVRLETILSNIHNE